MTQDELKKAVAKAAIKYVVEDAIVGVGTGSTANYFIDYLAEIKGKIEGAVASSEASKKRLEAHGIPVYDLNAVDDIPVYVDGADEADHNLCLVKGGGGALTREKIVAAVSGKFICIADGSKKVAILGNFPLPIEVIPMAQSHVGRALAIMGGQPILREGFTTDNGNIIIDVHNLKIIDPLDLENKINNIAGVVCNGIFAHQKAFATLVASESGIKTQK